MALDLSRPIAPPAKPAATSRASTAARKTAEVAEKRIARRTEGLQSAGQLVSLPLLFTGQILDAGAIAQHWPGVASEGAKLAEENDQVARVADFLCKVGPLAGVFTAALPLIFQIGVNHGWIPMSAPLLQFGVVDRETLIAKMQADAMRQQADMMKAMQEERAKAAQAMAEAQAAMADLGEQPAA